MQPTSPKTLLIDFIDTVLFHYQNGRLTPDTVQLQGLYTRYPFSPQGGICFNIQEMLNSSGVLTSQRLVLKLLNPGDELLVKPDYYPVGGKHEHLTNKYLWFYHAESSSRPNHKVRAAMLEKAREVVLTYDDELNPLRLFPWSQ